MLVFMFGVLYFYSNAFIGDFFFMRYWRASSSLLLSCLLTLGESRGEFFIESFSEVFMVLALL